MTQSFTQTFLVTPARQGVGLTSVALGIVRALQRQGVEVRFAKPVAQCEGDNSVKFAQQVFQTEVPAPLSMQDASERIAANQSNELMEDIVTLCMKAGTGASVLVVEGLHADASNPFASQLNVEIAQSLKAEIVVVADASAPNAISDLHLSISQYTNVDCKVAGVVF